MKRWPKFTVSSHARYVECSTSTQPPPAPQRRDDSGRYDFDGNLDRLCVCGHTLGDHSAGAPHDCIVYSFPEADRATMHNGDKPECGCMKFRQSRRKR